MLVKLQCPHCGASMEVNNSQDKVFCSYCGTEIANLKEKIEITQNVNMSGTVRHVMDRSNDPNLYISYASAVPNVVMIVNVVDSGIKNTYLNGMSQTYHLSQGQHTVVLKIGKKNYNRTIIIPTDNSPVRINATFTGRNAEITIDQPNVGNIDSIPTQSVVKQNKKPQSALAIISFILSMTMIGSVLGVPLSILDLVRAKKDEKHAHGMAIAGLIIGTIILAILAMSLFTKKDASDSLAGYAAITEKSTTAEVTDRTKETSNEKNEFDTKTNRICKMGNYSFQIPDYYFERDKEEGFIKYGTALKDADAILILAYFEMNSTQKEYDEQKDSITSELLDSISSTQVLSKESITVYGLKGEILTGTCKIDSSSDSYMMVHLFDPTYKNVVTVVFAQKASSTVDYTSDVEKIIRSLKIDYSNKPSSTTNENNSKTGIRPEFQKMMDDYLQFFKEYCEFIKKYTASPDMSMLTKYTEMMMQYAKAMEELEKIDEKELSDEELKLYLNTTNEINKMLIGLTGTP